jgi:hypothetical protein
VAERFHCWIDKWLEVFLYRSIHLSLSRFVDLSIYLSICLSFYLYFYLSFYLSVYPPIHLSIYLSIHFTCLSTIYLSLCLSTCLSICVSIGLSFYWSVCLFVYLSNYLVDTFLSSELFLQPVLCLPTFFFHLPIFLRIPLSFVWPIYFPSICFFIEILLSLSSCSVQESFFSTVRHQVFDLSSLNSGIAQKNSWNRTVF